MAATPGVTVYTTTRCAHCHRLTAFLRQQGVRFSEQNIERNRRAFIEFQRQGGKGVPLVLIGQQKLNGFNPSKLKQALIKGGIDLSKGNNQGKRKAGN